MSGCKCPRCYGLAEYMLEKVGRDHGLQRAQGCEASLRVLTMPAAELAVLAIRPCDGSMTCLCDACEADRARRVRAGGRDVVQPWEARKAA